jgi:periplasmic divalent cation tolerance protein
MDEIILVLSTLPADAEPVQLSRDLVEQRLAACVTVIAPVVSVYRWQGEVHSDREQQLVMKTTRGRLDALWNAVKARHPYETPEFVVIPHVEGNADYLEWIRKSVAERIER